MAQSFRYIFMKFTMNNQSSILDLDLDFQSPLKTFKSGDTIICQIQAKTSGGFVVGLTGVCSSRSPTKSFVNMPAEE
jgi:hypothetical protein